jgi:hypothetical protein
LVGDCGGPPLVVPPVFVMLKIAEPLTPATVAVTVKLPPNPFAVRVGAIAAPVASARTVADEEPLNAAPGTFPPGAENVTAAPCAPWPLES